MAFVLISKITSGSPVNHDLANALEHSFNKGSLKLWIESSHNATIANSTVTDSTISIFDNFNAWALTQTGFQYHLRGTTDDYTLEDVYVFNTKVNSNMFKKSLKTNAYFNMMLAYYTKNGITQTWIELN
jgi:hypothetical protein